jgi:hypothetical protein
MALMMSMFILVLHEVSLVHESQRLSLQVSGFE